MLMLTLTGGGAIQPALGLARELQPAERGCGSWRRLLRDGYGDIEPEILLDAMVRSQTRIVDLETVNLGNPRHSAARRKHAKTALEWATADRALVRQHEALLLSALR